MAIKFTNNAATTLAAPIGTTDPTLTVASGSGDNFPVVDGADADYFVVTMENSSGDIEFIRVDHRPAGSDTLGNGTYPCTRGYFSSAPHAWSSGDIVDLRWTAEGVDLIRAETTSEITTTSAAAVTYENLDANGDVGTGATQVAQGDHNHYSDAVANFTGVLQNNGSDVVVDTDIGVTVEPRDATIIKQADVDDTPVSGATTSPISSNWAYSQEADLATTQADLATTQADLAARSRKNAIINGNFDIWQRGTSQTSSGYGSDDRWDNLNSGSTKTHSRQSFTLGQTDVPGNPKYFSRTVVTSVAGAANYVNKVQRIEGVQTFAGETVTVSFYAKADASKNIAIELSQSFGTGGTPSSMVTGIGAQKVALTTSWQKFTATITVPSISGKTLGTDGNDFINVKFWFDAGSDYNSNTDTLGQQSGTFDIAQVQLEKGSTATDFERRILAEELALCQRYYEVSGPLEASGYAEGSGYNLTCIAQWSFATAKRTEPTVTRTVDASVRFVQQPTGYKISTSAVNLRGDSTSAGRTYWSGAEFSAEAEL